MKEFQSCPFCGSQIVKKYSGLKDRLDTTSKTFSVWECVDCHAALLNPMPVGDASGFYPANYLSREDEARVHSSRKFDLARWYRYNQYRFDFTLLRRASGPDIKAVTSYVDIGCGSGERVTFAVEQGCLRSFGVDKFDYATHESKQSVEIVNSEILDFKPRQGFQVASLFHVLEHVEDPRAVLNHIRSHVLAEGGYLLVQVPNYDSYERRLFKAKWFGLDAPRHLWHFNQHALTKLLKEAGYEVEGTYQLNAPLHPVSIVPSIFKDLDVQRIWVNRSHGSAYKKMMIFLWAGLTVLTIPLTVIQSLFNRSSMLTVIASNKER